MRLKKYEWAADGRVRCPCLTTKNVNKHQIDHIVHGNNKINGSGGGFWRTGIPSLVFCFCLEMCNDQIWFRFRSFLEFCSTCVHIWAKVSGARRLDRRSSWDRVLSGFIFRKGRFYCLNKAIFFDLSCFADGKVSFLVFFPPKIQKKPLKMPGFV